MEKVQITQKICTYKTYNTVEQKMGRQFTRKTGTRWSMGIIVMEVLNLFAVLSP